MIWTFTVGALASWRRDKITTLGGRPRTRRPDGDAAAKATLRLAAASTKPRGWRRDGCYSLSVYYTPGDWRRHDADRVLSLVPDALKGLAWDDDHDGQIVREAVGRASVTDSERGVCELLVGEVETKVRIEYLGQPVRVDLRAKPARTRRVA